MKIKVLGSCSDGNATLVTGKSSSILLDCGVSNLSKMKIDWKNLKGIFITHGHSDHISRLPSVIKKCDCPIYITKEEWESERVQKLFTSLNIAPEVIFIKPNEMLYIDDFYIWPVVAHHDTPLPVHYLIMDESDKMFFYGCDTCEISLDVYRLMLDCDLIMIDCNYSGEFFNTDCRDGVKLEEPYSQDLKDRIKFCGHMSDFYVRNLVKSLVKHGWKGKLLPAHTSFTYNSKDNMYRIFGKMKNVICKYRDEYPLELEI